MNIIKKLIGSSSPSSHHHHHNESSKHSVKTLSEHAAAPRVSAGGGVSSGSHYVSTSTSKVVAGGSSALPNNLSTHKTSVASLQNYAQHAGGGGQSNNGQPQQQHLQEQQQRLSIDRSRFWDSRLLIFHMIVRAKADEIATLQGNKGVDKLKMIAIMWRKIRKDPGLIEQLIRHGLLRACLVWLSPYPDGQVQSQQVQMRVMELLQSIKLDVNDVTLVGLDLAVFLLYGPRQQNQRADDLARNLLVKWYLSDKNLSKEVLDNPQRLYKLIRHEVAKRLQKTGINPPLLPEQTLRSYTANLQQIGPQDLDTESLSSASRKSSVSSQSAPHSRRNTKSSPKPIPGKGGDSGGASAGGGGGGGGGYFGGGGGANELDELNIPEFLEFTPSGELIEPDNGVFRSFPFFMRRFLKICRLKVFRQAKEDVLDENVNE